jgi:hypothetical protein
MRKNPPDCEQEKGGTIYRHLCSHKKSTQKCFTSINFTWPSICTEARPRQDSQKAHTKNDPFYVSLGQESHRYSSNWNAWLRDCELGQIAYLKIWVKDASRFSGWRLRRRVHECVSQSLMNFPRLPLHGANFMATGTPQAPARLVALWDWFFFANTTVHQPFSPTILFPPPFHSFTRSNDYGSL